MDWTEAKAREAEATLRKWAKVAEGVAAAENLDAGVLAALSDDLNTAGAIARLHALYGEGDVAHLVGALNLLGFKPNAFQDAVSTFGEEDRRIIQNLVALVKDARAAKRYDLSDEVRDDLLDLGINPSATETHWSLPSGDKTSIARKVRELDTKHGQKWEALK
jgi:cysteinyl-tRNA synthetase